MNSFPPGKFLMRHTSALFSGAYSAVPWLGLMTGEMASAGRGTMMSTLVALQWWGGGRN